MSKIIELRNKRNTLWEQTKAFLEEHRDSNGLVAADAVEQYNKMAADVKALGDEITRLEDQMEMDAKLSAPTSAPVHTDPKAGNRKSANPTATAEYNDAFWAMMCGNNSHEVRDALSVGVNENGGFTVPNEFEKQHHPHQLRYPHHPHRHGQRLRFLDRGRRGHPGIRHELCPGDPVRL